MQDPNQAAAGPPISYVPAEIAYNANILYFCRILTSTVAGCLIGVLGITGVYGFLMYFVNFFIISGLIYVLKVNQNTDPYFISKSTLFWDGIFHGMLTYIMFWTLFYDIVHIY
eukprot:TRINITY_DN1889_c0_g1_i1.p1 TRINITY_DN1889_c0_g1~~TRINITY_DN1889_c0_g1_i1.p1  ORF type:complete len:113 (+),score=7.21 TRINITY_DN1889_c0_g1_i1:109-447(+)